jgi:K+-sensing histidine kinase KdpD
MVCSNETRPNARVLILHRDSVEGSDFLDQAVALCSALPRPPVVLTVGRTERRAMDLQSAAREAMGAGGLDADFDLIAGCNAAVAVEGAAKARNCSLVILERSRPRRWWQCWRRDPTRRLLRLADRLTLVALPSSQRLSKLDR